MNKRFAIVGPVAVLLALILLLATVRWMEHALFAQSAAALPVTPWSSTIPDGYLRYYEPFTTTQFRASSSNIRWDARQGLVALERRHIQRQEGVVAVSNNAGHLYLIWQDARWDDGDIFVQRIDAEGNQLWATDRRAHRNTADVMQGWPAATVDASGNLLVVWVDWRNGAADIYAQRLDPNGSFLWIDDLRINQRSGEQGAPAISLAPDGRYVIAWHGNANGDYDIFAQQIDSNGVRQWSADIRINGDASMQPQVSPSLWSAAGQTLVVWLDQRFGTRDLYAQRIDSQGARLWREDRRINTADTPAINGPAVVGNRENIVWIAWQSGDESRITLQKVDAAGNLLFPFPRILATAGYAVDSEAPPALTVNNNDLVVAWRTLAPAAIVAQRLDAQAVEQWPTPARLNVNSPPAAGTWPPSVTATASTTLLAAWSATEVNRQTGVYGQHFGWDGALHWPHERRFSDATGKSEQSAPAVAVTAAGDSIVAWQDGRADWPVIYLQRFDPVGRRLWGDAVRLNRQMTGGSAQLSPGVAAMGEEAVAIWTDRRSGQARIYAQRIGSSGQLVWTRDMSISREQVGAFDQANGAVAANADSIVVAWEDLRGQDRRILVQRLNLHGEPQWPSDVVVSQPAARSRTPKVAYDDTGAVWILWLATQDDQTDVLAQRLDRAGAMLWAQPVQLNRAMGLVDALAEPSLALDAGGHATILWGDKRGLLLAQRFDAAGSPLWERDQTVTTASGALLNAALAVEADGHFVVAWQAPGAAARSTVALQRYDTAGAPVWNTGAPVTVGAAIRNGRLPQLALDAAGRCTVVWQEERFLNADIFVQRFDQTGQRLWGDEQSVLAEDAYFVQQGMVRSKEVDATATRIDSAMLTARVEARGGAIQFALSNDNGEQWAAVEPGVLHHFASSGSALRWQVILTANPDRLDESPVLRELTVDYTIVASTGVTVALPLIQR